MGCLRNAGNFKVREAGLSGKSTARSFVRLAGCLVLAGAFSSGLSGCSSGLPSLPKIKDLNPFAKKQQPLPGKRIAVLQTKKTLAGELASADVPIAVPVAFTNQDWTQSGGAVDSATGNLALSSGTLKQTWSSSAGTGSSKAARVTASPIVFENRVFALDASGTISAFSVSGGSAVWRRSLVPERETSAGGFFSLGGAGTGGYGGGLAADAGILYGVSGFGKVAALNPASGKVIWERDLGTAVRAAPAAGGGRVFVVTMEGRFYCLSAEDGTVLWVSRGLPQRTSLLISSSPVVSGEVVVVPYPSGDLVALKVADGTPLWSENLARSRSSSAMASLSDAARPAIDNGVVFGVGHGGRMVATKVSTGERLWTLNVPGVHTPWVAGDNVFVVDISGQLLAISRQDGKIRWTAKLPGAKTWAGPVLAGGLLWVASDKGQLVGVEAVTGRVSAQKQLGAAVFIPPVVALGRMFVLTDGAQLIGLN